MSRTTKPRGSCPDGHSLPGPRTELMPTGSVACFDACSLWLGVRVPLPFCRSATEGGAVSDSDLPQGADVDGAPVQMIRDLMIQDLSRAKSARRRS